MRVKSPGRVSIQGDDIVFDGFVFDGEGAPAQLSDMQIVALEWLKERAQLEIDKLKEAQP